PVESRTCRAGSARGRAGHARHRGGRRWHAICIRRACRTPPCSTGSIYMKDGTTGSHDAGLGGRRLILASNREPFKVVNGRNGKDRRYELSMGGLATALNPVLTRCDGLWVSWNPVPVVAGHGTIVKELRGEDFPFPLVQVGLDKEEIKGYYNGFCNRALWPLCHTNLRYVTPR